MFSFVRSAIATTLLLLSLQITVFGDAATNPPAIPPELGAADQLYRAGKFAEAESTYQALLNPTCAPSSFESFLTISRYRGRG